MVIEHRSASVEATRVPRIRIAEPLIIEVMTKLVAKRAEKRSVGGDLLTDSRPHPDADDMRFGMIIAE